MLKSRTLTVQINRPAAEVYAYVADPANLSDWTMVEGGTPEPLLGPLVWSFNGPRGRVTVHFTMPNAFFVLDYRMSMGPFTMMVAHVRLMANGQGCELVHTSVQQPGVPDEAFASEGEWMTSDLLVLKNFLEGTGPR